MQVAVTGITGFIGRNMLDTIINDGNRYICLVRPESNIANLKKPDNVLFKAVNFNTDELYTLLDNVDVVIHMIGQMGGYGTSVNSFRETNCKLTERMVKACISANVKQFIYLSTPGVQGFGKRLCKESEPYAPRNMYEQTKMEAEQIVIKGLTPSSVKYTIIRPDFVYGPEDVRRIKMYTNIRDKKFVLTTAGKSFLHPTYVMDVIQGINKTIGNEHAYNEIFNISADQDITSKEYLKTIADYFDVPLIHINIGYGLSVFLVNIIEKFCNLFLKRESFVTKNKIDFLALDHSTSNLKAQTLLDYHANFSFKEGFHETMRWCKENALI